MLNHDMAQPVIVRSGTTEWQASPSNTVRRKRFHLVGEPESGQVTSLVEYLPGSSFHRHEHPEGEEILVLQGIFSDDAGDWPEGSWLLNPEGFAHAPFSRDGCLLFVKLRQYPGAEHLKIEWPMLDYEPMTSLADRGTSKGAFDNVFVRSLLKQGDESVSVITLGADNSNAEVGSPGVLCEEYKGGVEGFLLSGSAEMNGEILDRHDWFRLPPGALMKLTSTGCTLYIKENNVARLRSVS